MVKVMLLKDIGKKNIRDFGEEAINLNKLYLNKFNVPASFIISNLAYHTFLEENDLIKDIVKILDKVDLEDESSLQEASGEIQDLFANSDFPLELKNELIDAYSNLDINQELVKAEAINALKFIKIGRLRPVVVIKRKNFNILNVLGEVNILNAVKEGWASLFDEKNIKEIIKTDNFDNLKNILIVQKMVNGDKSGIIFTNFENDVKIKVCLGLNYKDGDEYLIDKESLEVKNKNIKNQEEISYIDNNINKIVRKTLKDKGKEQKLNNKEIQELCLIAKKVENLIEKPQKISFVIESGRIHLLSSRSL